MTNYRRCAAVAVLMMLAQAAGFAQAKAAPAEESPLAPLAWIVGGTWVSDVKDSSDGTVTHVESRLHWAPNRQAIEFDVDFNGRPHYNGFYAYNAAAKSFGFYYTSSEGELTVGSATPDPDGKTLRQEFDITHTNGKVGHLRSTIVRDGNDAYWFTVFMQKDGEWAQVFRIRYERK